MIAAQVFGVDVEVPWPIQPTENGLTPSEDLAYPGRVLPGRRLSSLPGAITPPTHRLSFN